MTDLRVHPLAENEIGRAARFYEDRVPGLGKDFIAEVAHCFGRIQDFPQLGSADPEGFRRMFLRRFPYAVIYELVPQEPWSLPSPTSAAGQDIGADAAKSSEQDDAVGNG